MVMIDECIWNKNIIYIKVMMINFLINFEFKLLSVWVIRFEWLYIGMILIFLGKFFLSDFSFFFISLMVVLVFFLKCIIIILLVILFLLLSLVILWCICGLSFILVILCNCSGVLLVLVFSGIVFKLVIFLM